MTKISEVSVSAMSSPPIAGKIIRDPVIPVAVPLPVVVDLPGNTGAKNA